MMNMNRGRLNLLLSSGAFTISSAGSVLLHIILALTVYKQTGSAFVTSIFVALQWLPAFIVVIYRSDWDHGMEPRVRWYTLDIVSAILTIPVFFLVDNNNYLGIVLVLLLRGIVDHINRINKTVAARVLFPKDKTTHYASFLQSSYHIGIGLAATAGILFSNYFDLKTIVIIDIVTFLISASLIVLSKSVEQIPPAESNQSTALFNRLSTYYKALLSDRRLLLCASLMPMTATFFQGSYSVLQPIFPLDRFNLDSPAVSASYVLASIAIVTGSWSFSFFCSKTKIFDRSFKHTQHLALGLSLVAALLYIITVIMPTPILSALSFTLMIAVFEFLWMMGYSGTVAFAPKGQLGSVFGISFAIGCLLASLLSAGVGQLLDYLNNDYLYLIVLLMLGYLTYISMVLFKTYFQKVVAVTKE
jgi:MFS family permease